MQNVTIEIIMDYIWNFAIIWLVSFLGCFFRDVLDTIKNNTNVNCKRILVNPFFTSIALACFFAYVELPFPFAVLICFFVGWFSAVIVDALLDISKMKIIAKNVLKNVSNPIAKGVSESMKELKEIEDTREKENNETNDINNSKVTKKKKKKPDG